MCTSHGTELRHANHAKTTDNHFTNSTDLITWKSSFKDHEKSSFQFSNYRFGFSTNDDKKIYIKNLF